jgi:hypothetical protein
VGHRETEKAKPLAGSCRFSKAIDADHGTVVSNIFSIDP